jgi:hypothetical protein
MLVVAKVSKKRKCLLGEEQFISGKGNVSFLEKWIKDLPRRIDLGEFMVYPPKYPEFKSISFSVDFTEGGAVSAESYVEAAVKNSVVPYYKAICESLFSQEAAMMRRNWDEKMSRFWFYTLCYIYTDESLKNIGACYNQDHTTVLNAVKTIRNLTETKDTLALKGIRLLEDKLAVPHFERYIKLTTNQRHYLRKRVTNNEPFLYGKISNS